MRRGARSGEDEDAVDPREPDPVPAADRGSNAADDRYIAQLRESGIRARIRGEGLMRPQWAVAPDRTEQSCDCIVDAYMEGKTRRTLQHLTVEDQLRARS